jgi:hypothetical protein
MSSDYGLREACTQADGLALLQGFLKHNRLLADIHSPSRLPLGRFPNVSRIATRRINGCGQLFSE